MKITYGDFVDFLVERGAYESYMRNYLDINNQKEFENFEEFFKSMNVKDYCLFLMDNAFIWNTTLEGQKYWSDLYDDFEEYMKDYKRSSRLKKLNRLKLVE